MMQTGVVEAVSTKQVNTRFGEKTAYSVKIEGQWYGNGFKSPGVDKGQTVQFDYKMQGNYKNITSIVPTGGAPAPSGGTTSSSSWPIPKDSARDRSIIRQNCVGNAIKLLELSKAKDVDSATVISTARDLEAYCTGDLDGAESSAFDDIVAGSVD